MSVECKWMVLHVYHMISHNTYISVLSTIAAYVKRPSLKKTILHRLRCQSVLNIADAKIDIWSRSLVYDIMGVIRAFCKLNSHKNSNMVSNNQFYQISWPISHLIIYGDWKQLLNISTDCFIQDGCKYW